MNSRRRGLSITPGRQRKKSSSAVILRSSSDEQPRTVLQTRRARSFAQFTLSGVQPGRWQIGAATEGRMICE